jgi:phosphoserine phosphatase
VLAVELGVSKGVLTSELVDVPTDEKKAESLVRRGVTRPDAVFGNSIHDLAMLEMGRAAYPVNPTTELLQAAAGRGWGYFMPLGAEG